MYSPEKEYEKNEKFKKYVDKYALVHKVKPHVALTHAVAYIVGKAYYDKRKEGGE